MDLLVAMIIFFGLVFGVRKMYLTHKENKQRDLLWGRRIARMHEHDTK